MITQPCDGMYSEVFVFIVFCMGVFIGILCCKEYIDMQTKIKAYEEEMDKKVHPQERR